MQAPDWQQALKQAFSELDELLRYLKLTEQELKSPLKNPESFGLRVPREFADLIRKGDPSDPLLLQVLPSGLEAITHPFFKTDPVGDLEARTVPGLLHKYQGRVLIMATGACAVHCRYCFRRHYPYTGATASPQKWQGILDYLRTDPSIREVILSGGDPLMLEDDRLGEWIEQLAGISQLQRLRLHTRLPVVLPQRITGGLMDLLSRSPLQPVIVLHINHPRELSPALITATRTLQAAGITLLNQSVLLRGVNDSEQTLITLSEALFAGGILPYYLHMLDRVAGASHFEVSTEKAKKLHREMRQNLPGYLVPKLVREISGKGSKTPLDLT